MPDQDTPPTNIACAFADVAVAFIQVRAALEREELRIETADHLFLHPSTLALNRDDKCTFKGPSVWLQVQLRVGQESELVLRAIFFPQPEPPSKATITLTYEAKTGRWYVKVIEDEDFAEDDFDRLPAYRQIRGMRLFRGGADYGLAHARVLRQIDVLVRAVARDKRQGAEAVEPGDE